MHPYGSFSDYLPEFMTSSTEESPADTGSSFTYVELSDGQGVFSVEATGRVTVVSGYPNAGTVYTPGDSAYDQVIKNLTAVPGNAEKLAEMLGSVQFQKSMNSAPLASRSGGQATNEDIGTGNTVIPFYKRPWFMPTAVALGAVAATGLILFVPWDEVMGGAKKNPQPASKKKINAAIKHIASAEALTPSEVRDEWGYRDDADYVWLAEERYSMKPAKKKHQPVSKKKINAAIKHIALAEGLTPSEVRDEWGYRDEADYVWVAEEHYSMKPAKKNPRAPDKTRVGKKLRASAVRRELRKLLKDSKLPKKMREDLESHEAYYAERAPVYDQVKRGDTYAGESNFAVYPEDYIHDTALNFMGLARALNKGRLKGISIDAVHRLEDQLHKAGAMREGRMAPFREYYRD